MEKLPQNFRDKFVINNNDCWIWSAGLNKGYGRYWHNKKMYYAHRFSWTILIGDIPKNKVLDHYRLNPGPKNAPCSKACINPKHLEAVSQKENVIRANIGTHPNHQGSRTHCNNGHLFTDDNTYLNPRETGGIHRACRICRRERQISYRRRKRLSSHPL